MGPRLEPGSIFSETDELAQLACAALAKARSLVISFNSGGEGSVLAKIIK